MSNRLAFPLVLALAACGDSTTTTPSATPDTAQPTRDLTVTTASPDLTDVTSTPDNTMPVQDLALPDFAFPDLAQPDLAPSCSDGIKNQDETDVDCGGAHCALCPAGKACGGGADCATGLVCTMSLCSACTASTQCATGQVCLSGACGACTQSTQCMGGLVCMSGACSNCTATSQCASGLVCTSGACGACTMSAQCPGGQVCTSGACAACTASTQCGGGQVCTNGACSGCTASTQCAQGKVCLNGSCAACTTSTQCATGQVCLTGACGACTATTQCATGQACVSGACGACTQSSQCVTGQVCTSGVCGACTASTQCASGQVCLSGACGACTQSSQCATGQVCTSGVCGSCKSTSDCPQSQSCSAGACVVACTHTTLVDLSGNQHTGTLRNFNFTAASGWIGDGSASNPWALRLDGADDYIDIAPATDSLQLKSAFTEEVWTYLDAQGYQTIYTNRNGTGQYSGFHSGEFGGKFQYLFTTNGGTWNFLPSDGPSQVGAWTHLVGTYSTTSGVAHLYINGVQQKTSINSNAPIYYGPGALPRLGELGGAFAYHGRISIFRIYSTELSAAEVAAQYQKDAPRFGVTAPMPTATNNEPLSLYFDVGNCN